MFMSLRIAGFRTLWFGMLFSMAATQMNVVARSWLAFDISGAALAIGLVAVARGLPAFIITPFSGVAADRLDRRTLLIVTQIVLVVLSLATALLVQTGRIQVWHLMVIGFLQGMVFPFSMPTRTAMMSDLVGEDMLPNAIALDATGRNLNRVVAPAVGGLLLAVSPTITFYVIAVCFACATVTMLKLPSNKPDVIGDQSVLSDAVAGFRYVAARRTLLGLIAVSGFVVLIGMPYTQFLPVFQSQVLDVGEVALGGMFAAIGVGAIIASLSVASISEPDVLRKVLIVSGLGFGVSLFVFSLSTNYLLTVGMLVLVGMTSQCYLTVNKTLVMLETDRALYGRVMSVYMMAWAIMPFFILPEGAIVDGVGAQLTFAVAGALLLAAIVAVVLGQMRSGDGTQGRRQRLYGAD
jgi:MFS family permease